MCRVYMYISIDMHTRVVQCVFKVSNIVFLKEKFVFLDRTEYDPKNSDDTQVTPLGPTKRIRVETNPSVRFDQTSGGFWIPEAVTLK